MRSGLRSFDALTLESESQKHSFIDIYGGKFITGWSVHSGSVYKATVDEVFRGRRLDVGMVRLPSSMLVRVEAIADVVAGTFYFDPAASAATQLYVRLPDSSDPDDTAVLALFGFHFGNVRVVQPLLGPDKLLDGPFDSWSSPTALNNWTVISSGASNASVNRDASIVAQGAYSARLDATLVPGGWYLLDDSGTIPSVVGAMYRLSGWYRTDPANPPGIKANVLLWTGFNNIQDDGRTNAVARPSSFEDTNGEWRRFVWDVIAPDTAINVQAYMTCTGSTATGRIWFDGFKLQRIWRFEEYQERLAADSTPIISEGRRDIYYQRPYTGQASLSILNGSGFHPDLYGRELDELFGSYEFTSAPVHQWTGGRFPGGSEILRDGQKRRRWTARRPRMTPRRATMELQAPNQVLSEIVPKRDYDSDEDPDLAELARGRPKPLIFGQVPGIDAARVDFDANGYPIYGILDPIYSVNTTVGGSGAGAFSLAGTQGAFGYFSKEAADLRNTLQRKDLTNEYEDTESGGLLGAAGTPTKLFRITEGENDILDYNVGAGDVMAKLDPGIYILEGSGTTGNRLDDAINIKSSGALAMTFDSAAKKVTILKDSGSGTLALRMTGSTGTAANKPRSLWPMLGFTADADRTGFLTYVADDAIVFSADDELFERFSVIGYHDDLLGTYTGAASGPIELPGDIMYFLLRRVHGVPADQIDAASVAAVRAGADALSVYLGAVGDERRESGQNFEYFEQSNGIECLFDGDLFLFRKRDNSVPAGTLVISDRLVMPEAEFWYDDDDLASIIRVEGIQDPATGHLQSATISETHFNPTLAAMCARAKARLGRDQIKTFRTFLPGATAYIDELVVNATTPRLRGRITVKSAAMTLIPGDKITLALSDFPGAPSMTFRILNVEHNTQTWESTLELAQVLVGVTGGW